MEEIVRMLAADRSLSVDRLAGLEDFPISDLLTADESASWPAGPAARGCRLAMSIHQLGTTTAAAARPAP
jgi:hypothetical protein